MPTKAGKIVKPSITWILVADGQKAHVYTRSKIDKSISLERRALHSQFIGIVAQEPTPVAGMSWEAESADQYEVGRNATGMVFESTTSARHMSEPRLNVKDEIKDHFAKKIAEQLNQADEKKLYDRLMLIAPAKMLGKIKKLLDGKTQKKIIAEVPKDLTHLNGKTLAKHLNHIG